jgi:cell wall-associated NlpC family hydrolase
MKIIMLVAALVLTGCASSPKPTALERPPVVLSERALDEISSARARELALHALSHIGVPYRYGGSSPDDGFDCSGLVQYVYSRGAGIALPRTTQAMSTVGAPVSATELQPGDLVFFDTLRKPFSHVGIYVGDQRFIHAPTKGGVVELIDLRDRYWRSRYEGARRLSL